MGAMGPVEWKYLTPTGLDQTLPLDFLGGGTGLIRRAFLLANGAVMVDKVDEIQHEAELREEERRPWERPVLTEASLRHFTLFNSTSSDDNIS